MGIYMNPIRLFLTRLIYRIIGLFLTSGEFSNTLSTERTVGPMFLHSISHSLT